MTNTLRHTSSANLMQAALQIAAAPSTAPDLPIAAVLVHRDTGKILAQSANRVERDQDPTAHAEMVVIREGITKLHKNTVTPAPCQDLPRNASYEQQEGAPDTNTSATETHTSPKPYLYDYDLYVTLEPCPMCASAIAHARIGRLFFGAYDPKSGGVDHGACVFSHPQCHHTPHVVGGVMEQECGELLKAFFGERRI